MTLLIDVAEGDPDFSEKSAALLDAKRPNGLVICPVTFIEVAPVFDGNLAAQVEFLSHLGVGWPEPWSIQNTEIAFRAWNNYVRKKRLGGTTKRPIADILIGAFAEGTDGILTRNAVDFRSIFPSLPIIEP